MIVKTLTHSDANMILEARRQLVGVDIHDYESTFGSGEALDEADISEATQALEAIRNKYPSELKSNDPNGAKFDSEAAPALHTSLRLGSVESGNVSFWTWLAVAPFHQLIEWRHLREQG